MQAEAIRESNTGPRLVGPDEADRAAGSWVELRNVCRGFGEEWDREEVVRNLSFEITPGDLTAIIGPSGAGKSTIVNFVAGYDKPERGEILLNGRPVTGPGRDRMVVFQETGLMPWQTAYENLVFGPRLRGEGTRAEIDAEARRLLDRVGLGDFKDKYPPQLRADAAPGRTRPRADQQAATADHGRAVPRSRRDVEAADAGILPAAFRGEPSN